MAGPRKRVLIPGKLRKRDGVSDVSHSARPIRGGSEQDDEIPPNTETPPQRSSNPDRAPADSNGSSGRKSAITPQAIVNAGKNIKKRKVRRPKNDADDGRSSSNLDHNPGSVAPDNSSGINSNPPAGIASQKRAKRLKSAAISSSDDADVDGSGVHLGRGNGQSPNRPDRAPTDTAPKRKPRIINRPKEYKGYGRPSKFNHDVGTEVCRLMATGMSLKRACEQPKMPSMYTVFHWQFTHPQFSQMFARAQMDRAQIFGEEIIEIADDGRNDWMEEQRRGKTVRVADHEHIQRSRLRVDARKWLMSKLDPKRWGEKIQISGDADNPLQHVVRDLATEQRKLSGPELAALERFAQARIEASEVAEDEANSSE